MDTNGVTTVQKFLRSEVSFYLTIVGAILAFAGLYYGLSNRIDLLTQELHFHTEQSSKVDVEISSLGARLTTAERAIIILQK